jgi:hypothetical protein
MFLCYFYIWFLTFGVRARQSSGQASSKQVFLEFFLQIVFWAGLRSEIYMV